MKPSLRGFIVKETRHILRDRQTLLILLLLPLAQVLLFGYALRTDIEQVRLAVVDPVPDAASHELRSRFAGSGVYEIVRNVPTTEALTDLFEQGAIDQAVVFGPDFGSALGREKPAELLIITDATDPNSGSTMQAYARGVVEAFEREVSAQGPRPLRIVPELRMRFNPTLESVNLFIPGLIALVLTLVSALMSAISLSREKERGTMEVLLVSPLRPWQIIVGKVLPYLGLGLINVVTVLLAARIVFDVPIRGSVALLLAECLLFIVTSLALGILIAAITSSQRTAMIGSLLALMLPTTLLSGMIFPISSLPGWLQPVTHTVPAKWFILIARGIMLRGVGLDYLWLETTILLALTAAILVFAIRAFDYRLG